METKQNAEAVNKTYILKAVISCYPQYFVCAKEGLHLRERVLNPSVQGCSTERKPLREDGVTLLR